MNFIYVLGMKHVTFIHQLLHVTQILYIIFET